MILRNTAGQSVLIGPLLLVANGAAVTSGATIKTRIGGTTASGAGTLTHISGGVWEYAPTQAETDTAVLGLVLEGTSATSVPLTVPTTRFPAQTAGVLPAVASGSSGGVPLIGSSPLTNLDAAVSSRLAAAGYTAAPTASDNATAVWGNATRELTSGANLSIPTTADIADAVWDELLVGHAGAGSAGAILSAIVPAPTASDNATAVWASASRTLTTPIPTTAQIADGILGRNVAGGSDGGRTVKQALYALRNRVTLAAGTMTVYDTDDVAVAWTGAYTTDAAAEPIVGVDPS